MTFRASSFNLEGQSLIMKKHKNLTNTFSWNVSHYNNHNISTKILIIRYSFFSPTLLSLCAQPNANHNCKSPISQFVNITSKNLHISWFFLLFFLFFFRDGGYETSPLIGKFCGNQRPPLVVSHSNRLWIRFHSDAIITHLGFNAHWDGTQTGKKGNCATVTASYF